MCDAANTEWPVVADLDFEGSVRMTPNLPLNPDASPAALARRPLGAG